MEKVNTCKDCENFLGGGDWNLCCSDPPEDQLGWCGFLCYEDTPSCTKFKPLIKLSEIEFIATYCKGCGSQRCEGLDSPWFDGCFYRHRLNKKEG